MPLRGYSTRIVFSATGFQSASIVVDICTAITVVIRTGLQKTGQIICSEIGFVACRALGAGDIGDQIPVTVPTEGEGAYRTECIGFGGAAVAIVRQRYGPGTAGFGASNRS